MPPQRRRERDRGRRTDARMRMDSVRNSGFPSGRDGRRGYSGNNNPRRNRRLSNSPRRKELGQVMQNARRDSQSSYWTKRLLEAEEKDPNRWRHSGFKEMYRDELKDRSKDSDDSDSSDDSKSLSRSRSRSPLTTSSARAPSSPVRKSSKNRTPRSPPRRPRTPPPTSPSRRRQGDASSRSGRPRTPTERRRRSPSPDSYSSSGSLSSCSDESCSVCSPKGSRNHSPSSPVPPNKRPHPPPAAHKKSSGVRKIASTKPAPPPPSPPPQSRGRKRSERERRPKSPPPPPRSPDRRSPDRRSSGSSDSSDSSSESDSSSDDNADQHKVSLSERFGKMAQWSVDRREYESVKMKITKDASNSGMKVVIENEDNEYPMFPVQRPVPRSPTPEKDYAFHYEKRRYFFERTYSREIPNAPDAPVHWDDPVARYTYYRSKGLLWDATVTFDEYIKWEAWWERFQEWLDVERAYYGDDRAMENARMERERDWECYRTSNMGRTILEPREMLPLPRNQPWNRPAGISNIKQRIGPRRKFVR